MSLDAQNLVDSQAELYSRISKTVENLKKAGKGNITSGVLDALIKTLDASWEKFSAQHEILRSMHDKPGVADYIKLGLFDKVDMAYVFQRGALTDWAQQLQRPQIQTSGSTADQSIQASGESSKHFLSRLKITPFSGEINEWISYRDLFMSIMSKHPTLSNVEKLHFLRTSLEGEAAGLVKDLPLTGDNFERA